MADFCSKHLQFQSPSERLVQQTQTDTPQCHNAWCLGIQWPCRAPPRWGIKEHILSGGNEAVAGGSLLCFVFQEWKEASSFLKYLISCQEVTDWNRKMKDLRSHFWRTTGLQSLPWDQWMLLFCCGMAQASCPLLPDPTLHVAVGRRQVSSLVPLWELDCRKLSRLEHSKFERIKGSANLSIS